MTTRRKKWTHYWGRKMEYEIDGEIVTEEEFFSVDNMEVEIKEDVDIPKGVRNILETSSRQQMFTPERTEDVEQEVCEICGKKKYETEHLDKKELGVKIRVYELDGEVYRVGHCVYSIGVLWSETTEPQPSITSNLPERWSERKKVRREKTTITLKQVTKREYENEIREHHLLYPEDTSMGADEVTVRLCNSCHGKVHGSERKFKPLREFENFRGF